MTLLTKWKVGNPLFSCAITARVAAGPHPIPVDECSIALFPAAAIEVHFSVSKWSGRGHMSDE